VLDLTIWNVPDLYNMGFQTQGILGFEI
jgi:hypothetical protein